MNLLIYTFVLHFLISRLNSEQNISFDCDEIYKKREFLVRSFLRIRTDYVDRININCPVIYLNAILFILQPRRYLTRISI